MGKVCEASCDVKKQAELPGTAPVASACAAAGAGTGSGAALGNHTQSIGQFREVVDEKTGEIQRFRLDEARREYRLEIDPKVALNEARSGRFMLQRVARSVLKGRKNPRGMAWRVVSCVHKRISSEVAVLMNRSHGRAHYGGLMICGSVWTCPVCGAKISEHRRGEIHAATNRHVEAGGGMYMVTLTFAHGREDNVAELVKRLKRALKLFRDHRSYKGCRAYVDYVGLIRALEVTYGDENGWHPHVHELWLTGKRLSRVQLRVVQKELFEVWRVACLKAGLGEPNRKRGVDVVEALSAQDYVAKWGREPRWGVGSELAKAHTKRGRGLKSQTPFDLLRLAGEGDARAAMLFCTFAEAFFGSRQLFWSAGLKKALGVAEISDEAIAELEDGEVELVGLVSADLWRWVLKQPYDARGLLLELVESGGWEAAETFLTAARAGVR